MLTNEPTDSLMRKRSYIKTFRSKHKRYDFYASPANDERIDKLRRDYPTLSTSDVINDLVEAGYKALFPVS
jgi:hypothetical protein